MNRLRGTGYRQQAKGFTLIEILVVMAISIILMGLVLGPVVQSFSLMRQAQAMVNSQDAARFAMEQISRELGEAMFVYDNAVMPITEPYEDDSTPNYMYTDMETPIMLPVRQPPTVDKPTGDIQCFTLPGGKIDMVLPKITMHCNAPEGDEPGQHPAGEPRDYSRLDPNIPQMGTRQSLAWPPCPTCGSTDVEARPKLPLEQDFTIVRYFLGLRYNDPNDSRFGWQSPWSKTTVVGEENQVVLYRAEFSIFDDTLFPGEMSVQEKLSDPIFFYRTALNPQNVPFCKRWAEVARIVGVGKYEDLVIGTFDETNGQVIGIEPTITFKFAAIDNDTFTGAYSNDRASEYPNAVPSVYRAAHGYWTPDNSVTVYRYGSGNEITAYTTEVVDVGGNPHVMIMRRFFDGNDWSDPEQEFDITNYSPSGPITQPGSNDPPEMAFTIDPNRGAVYFALTTGPALFAPGNINGLFHDVYDGTPTTPPDRNSARRSVRIPLPGNARVVPGSERIKGPSMRKGPSYGSLVFYDRSSRNLGRVGPNEYSIDYDTGEVLFSPVYDQDIPDTDPPIPITVDYKIQFNEREDVVRGDYTTKSLVNIHLGMRMFDPESGKPHAVDLTNSVKVRNALR